MPKKFYPSKIKHNIININKTNVIYEKPKSINRQQAVKLIRTSGDAVRLMSLLPEQISNDAKATNRMLVVESELVVMDVAINDLAAFVLM